MSLQSFLFVAIDKLYNPFQNERKMTKYKDVDFVVTKDIVYDASAPDAASWTPTMSKRRAGNTRCSSTYTAADSSRVTSITVARTPVGRQTWAFSW